MITYTFESIQISDIDEIKCLIFKNTNLLKNDVLFITIENCNNNYQLVLTTRKTILDERLLYDVLCRKK
jgi:hypothetical protein